MKRKLVALSVVALAVLSAAALALGQETDDARPTAEAVKGIRIRFVGKAILRENCGTDESKCRTLKVSGEAFVCCNRARGTMTIGETTYAMVARKKADGSWSGALTLDGMRVGVFKGRRVGESRVFIGELRLDGKTYKLVLRGVCSAVAASEAE